ncbi:MAG: DNA polymerase IV [Desulfuromonadaceae bacterium]|nr:DNA polymerase IV [Desulfuromonadaceae bacterium]
MKRTIMHIDMNAFFAAVEQQRNPQLRGKPIAVTGGGKRTIITTSSYEARRCGVKTGMNLWQARNVCPELTLVVGNNRLYTDTSKRIIALFHDFTPQVEVFSVDEAFLDLSGSLQLFGSAQRVAYLLKARIRQAFGLTCSIGIAPNKLLAKLASEMQKPDGLTIIDSARIAATLEHLPIGELCGIGKRTASQLNRLGIFTCGELGRFPGAALRRKFGIIGPRLQRMGRGEDDAAVIPGTQAEPIKTVGHGVTLAQDIDDPEEIHTQLLRLSEMVGRRARRYRVSGRTVTLTIRYADFTTFSIQDSSSEWINRSDEIYRRARGILDRTPLCQPIRLLGIRLSGLQHQNGQLQLLDEDRRRQLTTLAMDRVNERYGTAALTFGSILGQESVARVIAPAWQPAGIRDVEVE